ncbi:hypothetical protein MASR1M65_28550 [Saprospiraceae bacterium]
MVRFSVFRPAFTLRLPPDFMQQNGISKTTKHHKPLRYAMKLNADLIKYYTKKGDCIGAVGSGYPPYFVPASIPYTHSIKN